MVSLHRLRRKFSRWSLRVRHLRFLSATFGSSFSQHPFLPYSDAVGFLNNGTRIAADRLPYRDYFAFLPPGTELT